MKAVVFDNFVKPEELQIGTVELPEVKEGELTIRIKAAGVNPVDAAIVQGYMDGFLPHDFPIVPGWDLSGIVEEQGFGARRFDVGDEVYAYARRPVVKQGTFAEYTVIPESYLSRKPENVSHKEAAGVPLVGLTAYQSLYEAGNLQKDQSVLILGASGGVGSFAVQLAKAKGANVIGVASEKNHSYMQKLGADETIDYKDTDIGQAVTAVKSKGVDLIFDCAGGDTLKQSLPALKNSGKLVSILNKGDDISSDIDFEYVFVEPNAKQLDHLREIIEAGDLNIYISNTFSLEETPRALEDIQNLHTKGKMVIVP